MMSCVECIRAFPDLLQEFQSLLLEFKHTLTLYICEGRKELEPCYDLLLNSAVHIMAMNHDQVIHSNR
ncbi:hypothetical protein HMI55_006270 [Coelomomyces lativittatus]|nr:hypothetical protein HMI55_006270 [Coelomomyces lativittatus]